ncbi:MAG: sugar ABC transporter substrate-binding protein [Variovorax sp.]
MQISFIARAGAALLLAASALTSVAQSNDAAQIAVEAASKFKGETLNMTWPGGAGALDPKVYTVPLWEKLTGVKVNVIETPIPEMFPKIMVEHRARTGAYDVVSIVPSWLADMASSGAIEPLDAFVAKYKFADELAKIEPAFRDGWMKWSGKIYGIPDDGDVLILYYRKDLFDDAANKAAFRSKYGYDLAPPATWAQFADIGNFFTDKFAPKLYGAGMIRRASLLQYFFQERFRNDGGHFFDAKTMKATVNGPAGVKALSGMVADQKFMPPGSQDWGIPESLNGWLSGNLAMTLWWPPVGRWSEGLQAGEKAMAFVPASQIAGKVGYALPPGGKPELALGWSLAVASSSKKKELAYLFIQFANSEQTSLERVMLPYSLRDPFRSSHYASKAYRALWPSAGEYLDILKKAAQTALPDLSIRNTFQYEESLTRAVQRATSGTDPKVALDDLAKEWDEITERTGVDKQREAYNIWAANPNAYPH